MTDFTIEFAGVCCYYRVRPPLIRVLLVDASAHPRFPHIPHLEVQHDCVVGTPPLPMAKINGRTSYSRASVLYDAYLLNGVRMSMPSADVDDPTTQPDFDDAVPQLTNVCPEFGSSTIADFADDDPPYGTPIAAQFDILVGSLDVSQLSKKCFFQPVRNDPPVKIDPPRKPGDPRELATGTRLTLSVTGDPYLEVLRLGDSTPKKMKFASGLNRIRIGNMAVAGILGKDEDDVEHFSIYYEMSDSNCTPLPSGKPTVVDDNPHDDPGSGLGGGCSNTQYP